MSDSVSDDIDGGEIQVTENPDFDFKIVRELYKGKELVVLDENANPTADEPLFVREGHFRFMDLPAELRLRVYQLLLPYNLNISHELDIDRPAKCPPIRWRFHLTTKQGETVQLSMGHKPRRFRCNMKHMRTDWPKIQTQVFLVNKEISNEARSVLYGSNTYAFAIDAKGHGYSSLRSLLIFGPLNTEFGLPMLRNLRSIRIDLELDDYGHWAATRLRSRLEFFVDILKEHLEDESKKTLLQELHVSLYIPRLPRSHPPGFLFDYHKMGYLQKLHPDHIPLYMFSLESLTALHAIKKATIEGVPDWFAQCLKLRIQGQGGELTESEWPLLEVKKVKKRKNRNKNNYIFKSKGRDKHFTSTKKWYHPTFNWKEFAQRNNIELPEDVDKYWAARV